MLYASDAFLGTWKIEGGRLLAAGMVATPLKHVLHVEPRMGSASDGDLGACHAEASPFFAAVWVVTNLVQQVFHTLLLVDEASNSLFGVRKTKARPNHAVRMPAELADVENVLHAVLLVRKAFGGLLPSARKAKVRLRFAAWVLATPVDHILEAQLLAMDGTSGGECAARLAIGRSRLAAWVLAALVDHILEAQLLAMGSAHGGDLGAGLTVARLCVAAWVLAALADHILEAQLLAMDRAHGGECAARLAIGRLRLAAGALAALVHIRNIHHARLLVVAASDRCPRLRQAVARSLLAALVVTLLGDQNLHAGLLVGEARGG